MKVLAAITLSLVLIPSVARAEWRASWVGVYRSDNTVVDVDKSTISIQNASVVNYIARAQFRTSFDGAKYVISEGSINCDSKESLLTFVAGFDANGRYMWSQTPSGWWNPLQYGSQASQIARYVCKVTRN